MKKETTFYIFLVLFSVVATSLRAIQINIFNLMMVGEISPLITVAIFILLTKKDSFKLVCFNRFNYKILVNPILILLIIISVDFFIQLQLNLINHPVLEGAIFIRIIFRIIIFTILVGGFEEIAWRGYLISKIIQNNLSWNSLIIITGTIWSIWHLPTHFFKFQNHLYIQYPLFIISCFELSIIMAYLRLKSNSVIPAIIIHSLIAVFIESFFKYSGNHETFYFMTFPSIALIIMLFPLAIYYYRKGANLHLKNIRPAPLVRRG